MSLFGYPSVHEERKNYQQMEASTLGLQPGEVVVSVGKNKRQPVQKWSGGLVWPGRVTLTDRALYFEVSIVFFHFHSIGKCFLALEYIQELFLKTCHMAVLYCLRHTEIRVEILVRH